MTELPTGTLTFLFTDLERSTWADEVLEQFARAEPALVEGLGTERGAALQARGASMPYPDLVGYLRTEAAMVLGES